MYKWGKYPNNHSLKTIPWTKEIQDSTQYIEEMTGQYTEYVMITKYEKQSLQPWHDDRNSKKETNPTN